MSDNFIETKLHGSNPITALGLVVLISIILVTIATITFLNSSSYQTVQQIQAGLKSTSESDLQGYDTTSPVKAEDIDQFTDKLDQKLAPIGSEDDFLNPSIDYPAVGL